MNLKNLLRLFAVFIVVFLGILIMPNARVDAATPIKKVVIDPGHGGKDSGSSGNGLVEKDLTLDLSKRVNQQLSNKYVVETKMTRDSDVFIQLEDRTKLANDWKANLFLSIHINSGGGSGYEDYVHSLASPTSEDKKVQQEINREINKVLQSYKKVNRGQKKADFKVLRQSKMASVLLEIMFIDNKSDSNLLKSDAFLNDISGAIATGVGRALQLPVHGENSVVASPPPKPKSPSIKVNKASGNYTVTATSLNVRSGNGTSYKSVGSLKKNATVKVTGKTSNNWYRITYKGKDAYVSGTHIKVKPKSKAKPAPKPKPKPKSPAIKVNKASGNYTVTATSLNVRSGNGTSYKSVGSLKKNATVKVTGKTSNNWYRITYKGKSAYVSGAYLKRK